MDTNNKHPTHDPDWTLDEEILALDLYFRAGRRVLSGNHPEVIALSEVLNALPIHPPKVRSAKFRNPAGVNTKLANLRWVDPEIEGGLSRGSKLDQVVWDLYAHDPDRLRQVAEAIRQNGSQAEVAAMVDEPDEEAPEGRVLLRAHKVRERNRGLVQRRKALAMKRHGKLACEVCGFDFQAVYGELGEGFIECHHTVPVSQLQPGQTTKVSDLALLCANGHRMILRRREVGTVQELAEAMAQENNAS